jgi:hypothetical protein
MIQQQKQCQNTPFGRERGMRCPVRPRSNDFGVRNIISMRIDTYVRNTVRTYSAANNNQVVQTVTQRCDNLISLPF